MPDIPRAPAGLGTAGRALWRALHTDFDLAEHERRLLTEACRTADLLDQLAADVAEHGPLDSEGQPRGAVVEARQQRQLLARLLASLRVPDADDTRAPRRGARGAYGRAS